MDSAQPFHLIAKTDTGVSFSGAHLMCDQQVAIPVKAVGDHITLVLAELNILGHIRHEQTVAVILTRTNIIEPIIIKLCQHCPAFRIGKQPVFECQLNFRLFLTGKNGFFFVEYVFCFFLAGIRINIIHRVFDLHRAEVHRLLQYLIGVFPVGAVSLVNRHGRRFHALIGDIVSAVVSGEFNSNGVSTVLVIHRGLEDVVHELLVDLSRNPRCTK